MKKMSKKTREYIANEFIRYFKIKKDIERKKIIHAYFEKKEYEKTKKVH
jgi:poly(A) polymerase Pap1